MPPQNQGSGHSEMPLESSQSSEIPMFPPHCVRLGDSDLVVSRIALGMWPMAGITSVGVSEVQSIATVEAAVEQGINFFDTAFAYGYNGESDRVLRAGLGKGRTKVIIAHKVGTHWNEHKERCIDGSRARLIAQAEECLKRLGTDYLDVLYLHTPDPKTPIEESAGAIQDICQRGWARHAAVSNVSPEQALQFHRVCPVIAIQPYFNMFQQDAVRALVSFARVNKITMACYWILMKGLLAGKLARDHVFDPNDRRLTYSIFQGEAWQRAQDLLDHLRAMSLEHKCTVSQLVIAWSLAQPGVDVALLGAKRPEQIVETARAMHMRLDSSTLEAINGWIATAAHPVS
jgi:aryl-alcohol dehydrogenase-like predicted oxidoreductase